MAAAARSNTGQDSTSCSSATLFDQEMVGHRLEARGCDRVAEHVLRPCTTAAGVTVRSLETELKVAALARPQYQPVRPKAYRLTEAVCRLVMILSATI